MPVVSRAPDKILGASGPRKFWVHWRMIQKRISRKISLANCDFRKSGGNNPGPPPIVGGPGSRNSFGARGKALDVNLKQIEPWTNGYNIRRTDETLK